MRIRVPASSANLGPGFDALGLALSVYLECEVSPADELTITVDGRDAHRIPCDASNLIWQTALRVAEEVGGVLPPIRLAIHNDIPLGKGLGSSAAALTTGVILADRLLGLNWKRPRILNLAARIEGHPDNVAACVLGSIVASAIDEAGDARAVRIELPEKYGCAIVVPDFELPTKESRQVLPTHYSRADAVFNVQRAALLIAALITGSTTAFPLALEDRIHQPYRSKLVPGLDEILRLRAPGLLGCCLSGAGPSVLVFYERGSEDACDLVRQIFTLHGQQAEIVWAQIAGHGYDVLESAVWSSSS
jgi:homoserine kinase